MRERIITGLNGRVIGAAPDASTMRPNPAGHALKGKTWQEIMAAPIETRKSFMDSHPFEYEAAQRDYYISKGVPLQPLTYTPTPEEQRSQDVERVKGKIRNEEYERELREYVQARKQK